MTYTVTITKLRRPKCHGMITHEVQLPAWRRPIGVGSIEDAHKVAAEYASHAAPGDTVIIDDGVDHESGHVATA